MLIKPKKDQYLAAAEKAAYEINQIIGSGDDPFVMQIDGMISYFKGDKNAGIKKMYTAYEKLKQTDTEYTNVQLGELSYALAKAYENTTEIGARQEFLYDACRRGKYRTRPDCLIEYSQICLNLRTFDSAVSTLDLYDKFVGSTNLSKTIRARALMGAGQIDDAEALLAKINSDDIEVLSAKFNLLQLKADHAYAAKRQDSAASADIDAEINKFLNSQVALAQTIISKEPNMAAVISSVAERYIALGNVDPAKAFIDKVLAIKPDLTAALIFKNILLEKDPTKVTPQRRAEISEAVISKIADQKKKALALVEVYKSQQQLPKALAELKKAWDIDQDDKDVMSLLFETALQAEDLKLAEQLAGFARKNNSDQCDGLLFAARLAMVNKDYKDALAKLDSALQARPVSSVGYLLRSNVHASLENNKRAIDDARKASEINPLDGLAAKQLASLLYQRNLKLGQSVSDEQMVETREAIKRAYVLNQREWQLLSFYADYISADDPKQALSIRQLLQANVPTVENAVRLGILASQMAAKENDKTASKALWDIAGDAYQQGYKIGPDNSQLLINYAQYLRAIGKPADAAALLAKSKDQDLLWQYQLSAGQFDKAREMLASLYKKDSKNPLYLKGLLLIAQQTRNADDVLKFSQELIAVENKVDHQIAQIQALLEVGLIPQAQKQLDIFLDKNPDNTSGLQLQAQLMMRKGDYPKALEMLTKCLTINESDVNAWRLKGSVYFMQGKYDDSIRDLQKAKNLSGTTRIRIDLAKSYLRAKRGDDAINELIVAIKEDENSFEARQILESVYLLLGKIDAVKKFYSDTITQFPENLFWYTQAGALAINQKDYSTAAEIYRNAWQIVQKSDYAKNPAALKSGLNVLDGYLGAFLLSKQYEQVIANAAKYIDSSFAPIALARMADAKSKLGDSKSAVDLYYKALQKCGADEALLVEIISRMSSVVGVEQAVAWCNEQLKVSPDSGPVNFAMSNLSMMSGQHSKALDYLEKCMKLTDEKSPMYRNLIGKKVALLISAYDKTGDKQYLNDAIRIHKDIIKKSSVAEWGALNDLAYLLASNTTDYDLAVEYAQKAYEAVPTNTTVLDTYAFTLFKKGEFEKAAQYATLSLQMYEQSTVSAPSEVYEHLGMIKEKLNKKADALAAYRQALDSGDKNLSDASKERIRRAIENLK